MATTGTPNGPIREEEASRLNALWNARHKISQEEFGQLYGIGNQSWVNQLLKGKRPLNLPAARAFADHLGIQIEEFSPRLAAELRGYRVSEESGPYLVPPHLRGVPIVGTAQLGKEGFWHEFEHPPGYGEGRVRWLSKDRNAYAVRLLGDSMHPRFKSGEFAVIEPNHVIRPDDDVLVATKDGRKMIKTLASRRDGLVALNSVNDLHPRITLREDEIDYIHFVAGRATSVLFEPE